MYIACKRNFTISTCVIRYVTLCVGIGHVILITGTKNHTVYSDTMYNENVELNYRI